MSERVTLWMVGMMGSGKSTVGRALAERLGRAFADTDEEIERESGRSVSEIFEHEGEPAFREKERAAIERFAGEPAVVALGGGAMAQPGVPERLAASGTVVYLRARPETLLERLGQAGTRPLLAGLDADARREKLERMLAERSPAYERAALVVDTDGLEPAGVVDQLADRVGSGGDR